MLELKLYRIGTATDVFPKMGVRVAHACSPCPCSPCPCSPAVLRMGVSVAAKVGVYVAPCSPVLEWVSM